MSKIQEDYKNDFDFIDLNGITGDFTAENPYKGLDEFKLGFNPYAFEYIGEYDFIINESLYKAMEQSGQLAKEFNKQEKSTNNQYFFIRHKSLFYKHSLYQS